MTEDRQTRCRHKTWFKTNIKGLDNFGYAGCACLELPHNPVFAVLPVLTVCLYEFFNKLGSANRRAMRRPQCLETAGLDLVQTVKIIRHIAVRWGNNCR